jgi:hypothetical protein
MDKQINYPSTFSGPDIDKSFTLPSKFGLPPSMTKRRMIEKPQILLPSIPAKK